VEGLIVGEFTKALFHLRGDDPFSWHLTAVYSGVLWKLWPPRRLFGKRQKLQRARRGSSLRQTSVIRACRLPSDGQLYHAVHGGRTAWRAAHEPSGPFQSCPRP